MSKYNLIVVGGGAAGFFAAINYAALHVNAKVLILEKSPNVLAKVKVSGGGRCNVTHACFEVKELVKNYPRGEKELLGVFNKFNTTDTIDWFNKRGIELKVEQDGRMFPVTNSSQTIIDCFLKETVKYKIELNLSEALSSLEKIDNLWHVATSSKRIFTTENVLIAGGSSEKLWGILAEMNLSILKPVPSLFTFNINDARINNLQGLSVPNAGVSFDKIQTQGPLLITHWGLSGPAVLKFSAWAARILHEIDYDFTVKINFNNLFNYNSAIDYFLLTQKNCGKQKVSNFHFPDMPNRLWLSILTYIGIENKNWADISKKQLQQLASNITEASFQVKGKSTFKEEFVTAGGVSLKEIDFKTMQSKQHQNLFFAGEVLDIDAVTGGFNFQAAWSTAWIAANNMSYKNL